MQIGAPVLRLIVRPHLERGGFHIDRFDAGLDGELIVTSRQPLLDGARRLLERGFDPEALLTMRMHDRPYDSFHPKPVREWAKWTIAERDRRGLQRERRLDQTMPCHAHMGSPAGDEGLAGGRDSPKASATFLDPASDGRSGMSTMALTTSCGHSVTASNAGKKHRLWRHGPNR
jgi:hypothetical protein